MRRAGTRRRRTCARAGCRRAASRVDAVAVAVTRRTVAGRADSCESVCGERRRSTERCARKRGSQASAESSIGCADSRSGRPDRLADEIADARQELGAHRRMEAFRVGAADREQAGRRLRGRAARARPSRSRPCRRRTGSRAGCRGSGRSAAGRIRTAFRTSSARPRPASTMRRCRLLMLRQRRFGGRRAAAAATRRRRSPRAATPPARPSARSASRARTRRQARRWILPASTSLPRATSISSRSRASSFSFLSRSASDLALDQRDGRRCRGCAAASASSAASRDARRNRDCPAGSRRSRSLAADAVVHAARQVACS